MSVPYTAHCPSCQAGRTFSLLTSNTDEQTYTIGCVVCGMTERDALREGAGGDAKTVALQARILDAQATTIDTLNARIAEQASAIAAVAELRDDLHEHAADQKAHRL